MRTSEKSPRKWGLRTSPTYRQCELTLNLDDYGKKESTTIEISQGTEGSDRGTDCNP